MNWHLLARAAYTIICGLLVIWGIRTDTPPIAWLLWILPPLYGLGWIRQGSRQSLMYCAFLLIIPFCHGITVSLTVPNARFAWLESGLAFLYFLSFFFAYRPKRHQSRESR